MLLCSFAGLNRLACVLLIRSYKLVLVVSHIVIGAIWIGLSALAGTLASVRGYGGLLIFAASIFASPLLTLPLILLAPRRSAPRERDLGELPAITFCAHCSGKVMRAASCCLHCGAVLPTANVVVPFR